MSHSMGQGEASTLAVDEAFASGDDRFVELLRGVTSPQYLAALADRWKRDPRPWAREQIVRYLAQPMDRPGHEPVVKRLFKQAEANRDDELMAHFLVAFDRLVRRERHTRRVWDHVSRRDWQQEVLYSPSNVISRQSKSREGTNPFTGETMTFQERPARVPKNGRLFSHPTRRYLRRRAWRYFRWMGFQRPDDYPRAIAVALKLYRDEDFALGENILDCWSLMNVAFYRSPVLKVTSDHVNLADGQSLEGLEAAPRFEKLWAQPDSASVLFGVLAGAGSRLVRTWCIELLQRHHAEAMQSISPEQLLTLLDHDDELVQQFAANLVRTMSAVDSWPIEFWLRLLETRSVNALLAICDVMGQRVDPERLSLQQLVAMACARATPVARLGLEWLKERPIRTDADRATLAGLAEARCDAIGVEAAEFALAILGSAENYETENVVRFFDSLNATVRQGAWSWLTPESLGFHDTALWSRLTESPYDDVRLRLVDELNRRVQSVESVHVPRLQPGSLAPIWTTVLLNVHRGSRAKLKALRQISLAIAERPETAEQLIPVLAVSIRSVRPAEVRAGLASVLTAVAMRPELEALLAQHIPELRLTPTGTDI